MNIPAEKRLNILLSPDQRRELEATLLQCAIWEDRAAEMPPECRDVVTGQSFYCGCEGIGYTDRTGWYLVLWEPGDVDDPPPVKPPGLFGRLLISLGLRSPLTLVRSDVYPNRGPSKLTLLFMEHPGLFLGKTTQ